LLENLAGKLGTKKGSKVKREGESADKRGETRERDRATGKGNTKGLEYISESNPTWFSGKNK
jgi:hypothetical protein